ncbi:MAG: hypothetical protein JOY92_06190 [Verrucomicrobia bacterium]|nr:hypothetical protein [Verrucomicrobiota bacterium]
MNAGELPQYLTLLQFAALTHSHKRSVLNAIATGRIRCERLEQHTLVIPSSEISRIHSRDTKCSRTMFRKR